MAPPAAAWLSSKRQRDTRRVFVWLIAPPPALSPRLEVKAESEIVVGPTLKMAPFRLRSKALRCTVSSPPPSLVIAAPELPASMSAKIESLTATVPPAL